MRPGSRTDPTLSVPPPPEVDREAPTRRPSGQTFFCLTLTQELLARIGETPGLIFDALRARLQGLEQTFQGWPNDPPDIEDRLTVVQALTELQRQVHAAVTRER